MLFSRKNGTINKPTGKSRFLEIFSFYKLICKISLYGYATGNISGNNLWKATVATGLSGAAYGAYTPV